MSLDCHFEGPVASLPGLGPRQSSMPACHAWSLVLLNGEEGRDAALGSRPGPGYVKFIVEYPVVSTPGAGWLEPASITRFARAVEEVDDHGRPGLWRPGHLRARERLPPFRVRAARDRVARLAQGWAPMRGPKMLARTARTPAIESVEELGRLVEDLARRLDAVGRSVTEIDIVAGAEGGRLASEMSTEQCDHDDECLQETVAQIKAGGGQAVAVVGDARKAAVTSLTRSLTLEFAPLGIRVNTIAPDVVPTAGMAGISRARGAEPQLADTPRGRLAARVGVPMGRAGRYEDVGGCALFLASDLARFVTGTSLHPDGGALASSGWFNWPDAGYANFPPAGALRGYLDDEAAAARQEMARHIISEPEGA
jgi:hypothetical protein